MNSVCKLVVVDNSLSCFTTSRPFRVSWAQFKTQTLAAVAGGSHFAWYYFLPKIS